MDQVKTITPQDRYGGQIESTMDKYERYRKSMLDAGYVPVPRGYVTKEDAEIIKTMLVKKTDSNNKMVSKSSCAQP